MPMPLVQSSCIFKIWEVEYQGFMGNPNEELLLKFFNDYA